MSEKPPTTPASLVSDSADMEGAVLAAPEPAGVPVKEGRVGSLWADAWRDLRARPMFLIPMGLLALIALMSLFPSLFTGIDPRSCQIRASLEPISAEHWFGTNTQGCDVYARAIHGASASISAGLITTVAVVLLGSFIGVIAGYYGGWLDSVLSRLSDIFLAVPLLLGALVMLSVVKGTGIWGVVLVLSLLGWPSVARIMRGSVLTVKQSDYVVAARALGAGDTRIIMKHILPNAIAPVIVVATISLGIFIATEATLSYLGIGLQDPVVSWGLDISSAQTELRNAPMVLFFPAAFLSVTVFSFIMLGDAVRDALDPKLR